MLNTGLETSQPHPSNKKNKSEESVVEMEVDSAPPKPPPPGGGDSGAGTAKTNPPGQGVKPASDCGVKSKENKTVAAPGDKTSKSSSIKSPSAATNANSINSNVSNSSDDKMEVDVNHVSPKSASIDKGEENDGDKSTNSVAKKCAKLNSDSNDSVNSEAVTVNGDCDGEDKSLDCSNISGSDIDTTIKDGDKSSELMEVDDKETLDKSSLEKMEVTDSDEKSATGVKAEIKMENGDIDIKPDSADLKITPGDEKPVLGVGDNNEIKSEDIQADIKDLKLEEVEEEKPPVKLEESLFDEDCIDGFSFLSFDNYKGIKEVIKWQGENPGEIPDPWYPLKFKPPPPPTPPPPPPPPPPEKVKKEKKEKKPKAEKIKKKDKMDTSEKGANAGESDSDLNKTGDSTGLLSPNKKLNGHQDGGKQRKSPGAAGAQSSPLNFSQKGHLKSPVSGAGGVKRSSGGGLYRPYSTSPTPSKQSPGSVPSHQNPAPGQFYSAPSVYHRHHPSNHVTSKPGVPPYHHPQGAPYPPHHPHYPHHPGQYPGYALPPGYPGAHPHPAYRPSSAGTTAPADSGHQQGQPSSTAAGGSKAYPSPHGYPPQPGYPHSKAGGYPGYPPGYYPPPGAPPSSSHYPPGASGAPPGSSHYPPGAPGAPTSSSHYPQGAPPSSSHYPSGAPGAPSGSSHYPPGAPGAPPPGSSYYPTGAPGAPQGTSSGQQPHPHPADPRYSRYGATSSVPGYKGYPGYPPGYPAGYPSPYPGYPGYPGYPDPHKDPHHRSSSLSNGVIDPKQQRKRYSTPPAGAQSPYHRPAATPSPSASAQRQPSPSLNAAAGAGSSSIPQTYPHNSATASGNYLPPTATPGTGLQPPHSSSLYPGGYMPHSAAAPPTSQLPQHSAYPPASSVAGVATTSNSSQPRPSSSYPPQPSNSGHTRNNYPPTPGGGYYPQPSSAGPNSASPYSAPQQHTIASHSQSSKDPRGSESHASGVHPPPGIVQGAPHPGPPHLAGIPPGGPATQPAGAPAPYPGGVPSSQPGELQAPPGAHHHPYPYPSYPHYNPSTTTPVASNLPPPAVSKHHLSTQIAATSTGSLPVTSLSAVNSLPVASSTAVGSLPVSAVGSLPVTSSFMSAPFSTSATSIPGAAVSTISTNNSAPDGSALAVASQAPATSQPWNSIAPVNSSLASTKTTAALHQQPVAAPIQQLPGAAPKQQLPGAAPIQQLPGAAHSQQQLGPAPLQQQSGAAPLQQQPGAATLHQLPGTAPYNQQPTASDAPLSLVAAAVSSTITSTLVTTTTTSATSSSNTSTISCSVSSSIIAGISSASLTNTLAPLPLTVSSSNSLLPPPGAASSLLPPPGAVSSLLPPHGAVSALLPPSGVASSLLPRPGAASTLLPPSGASSALLPPPGAASSLLPPHSAAISSLLPPPEGAALTSLPGGLATKQPTAPFGQQPPPAHANSSISAAAVTAPAAGLKQLPAPTPSSKTPPLIGAASSITSVSAINQPPAAHRNSASFSGGIVGSSNGGPSLPGAGGPSLPGGVGSSLPGAVGSSLPGAARPLSSSLPGAGLPTSSVFSSSAISSTIRDIPKLGGPNSLFYQAAASGLPSAGTGPAQHPHSATSLPYSAGAPAPRQSSPSSKKPGKWNAMHVRIAYEIYNHQQRAKSSADPTRPQSSAAPQPPSQHQQPPHSSTAPASHHSSSISSLHRSAPNDLKRPHSSSTMGGGGGPALTAASSVSGSSSRAPSMASGAPPPSNHPLYGASAAGLAARSGYDMMRNPYGPAGAPGLYAPHSLGYPGYSSSMVAAAAAHPTQNPFGGLGAPLASRPPGSGPLPGVAAAYPSPQQYKPGGALPSQPPSAASASHLERERRDREDRERRDREEREQHREREDRERREREERERRFAEQQRARDLELRGAATAARLGNDSTSLQLPHKGDKERTIGNSAESDRDRSPIRSDSSPQIIEVGPSSKSDDHMVVGGRSKEDAGLDMTTGGMRPSSSSSSRPHPASSVDKPGSRGAASSTGGDDEIFIVAEKEGTRPRGGVPTGPPSGPPDPMAAHHRMVNGLVDDPRLHPRNSPAGLNGPGGIAGHKPGSIPGMPGGVPPGSALTGPSAASYYSRSLLGAADPYGMAAAAASLPPTSAYSLAAANHHQQMQLAAAGLDPRTAALMSQPLMGNVPGAGSLRAANPYDPMSMALDPFRDPYRDLFRDPLREARDRELMDRAKMMQLAAGGYSLPGYGYPPSSVSAGHPHQKYVGVPSVSSSVMPSALGLHGLMGGLPPTHPTPPGLASHHSAAAAAAALGHHPSLSSLNGAGGYKDPTRR